jgi:spermidine synthase
MAESKARSLAPYAIVVVLTSLALLDAQVSFTRLLSYRFYYHYVFFVVSLAQLGLGAAGALLYWKRTWLGEPKLLIRCLIAMSLFALATMVVYVWLSPSPNLSFAKADPQTSIPYLLTLSLLLVGFNFAGGLVLTLIFTRFQSLIGRFYAADLLGAAVGCAASVGLMWAIGPPLAFLSAAALAAVAAVVMWGWCQDESPSGSSIEGWLLGAVVITLTFAFLSPKYLDPNIGHSISDHIIRSEWTHIARVDAQRSSRYVIDGDASTDIFENQIVNNSFPEYEITRKHPDVAIVGVGAGPDLKAAVGHDANSVLAIDINPTIIRWDMNEDSWANGYIFLRPEVEVKQGEGRHVLRSSNRKFDLIVMYAIDTWTASSQGAYSLTENFLYTTEAVQDYYSRLEPDGLMSIRRWMFNPPREMLRVFSTVLNGLEKEGVADSTRHVVVLTPTGSEKRMHMGYLMFSRSPLTEERLEKLDAHLAKNKLKYMYRPGLNLDTPYTRYANAADRSAFVADYPYLVSPANDDTPFFFLFQPPWRASNLPRHLDSLYSDSGTVLFVCLATVLLLTGLLLGVPLWARRKDLAKERGLLVSLLYFGGIGVGFMGIELVGVQSITLFLGHPTYALSVVLMGMLASAGLGSFLMEKLRVEKVDVALIVIVALTVGSSFLLLPAIHSLIERPFWFRLGMTFVWLLAVATPLGMPFVGGIRTLGRDRPHAVAWAWACNGAASVIGSCLVMILMVYAGSRVALLFSAVAYGLAFMTRRWLSHGTSVICQEPSAIEETQQTLSDAES